MGSIKWLVVLGRAAAHPFFSTRLMSKAVMIGIRLIEKVSIFPMSGWQRSKKKRKMMAKRYLEGPSKSLKLNCIFPKLVKRILTTGRVNAVRMKLSSKYF